MARKIDWISEAEAAQKLGYQPRTLRKLVKGGTLAISYTSLRGRNFFYDEKAIEQALFKSATVVPLVNH